MRKIIILSAATLILSSCGIYNKYKPVSEVPEGLYGSESVAATDTANFGNLSWREVFTDPYLQNLVDSALLRNTDMQTAHLRVKEAEATLLTSKLSSAFFVSGTGRSCQQLRPWKGYTNLFAARDCFVGTGYFWKGDNSKASCESCLRTEQGI